MGGILKFVVNQLSSSDILYRFSKQIVRKHDNNANCDINTNGEMMIISHLIERKAIELVVDAGAHAGLYCKMIKQLDPKIRVIAIEPSDDNVRSIEELGLDVEIQKVAVSDHDGEIIFHRNIDRNRSSSDSIYDMSMIGYDGESLKVALPCMTLDTMCSNLSVNRISYLKIDVEGHEFDVLIGCKKLLSEKKVDFIQFEFGHACRAARRLLLDYIKLLGSYGFTVFSLNTTKLEEIIYSPFIENKWDMINLVAVEKNKISLIEDLVAKRADRNNS